MNCHRFLDDQLKLNRFDFPNKKLNFNGRFMFSVKRTLNKKTENYFGISFVETHNRKYTYFIHSDLKNTSIVFMLKEKNEKNLICKKIG